MSGIKESNFGIRNVASVRLGASREEEWIDLAANSEQRWPMDAEIFLECGVERHVGSVVEDQIKLDLLSTRARHVRNIQRITVWRDALRVGSVTILKVANRRRSQ